MSGLQAFALVMAAEIMRITGSVDFVRRNALRNQIPQPTGTNFSTYVVANVGDMTNKVMQVFNINAASKKQ